MKRRRVDILDEVESFLHSFDLAALSGASLDGIQGTKVDPLTETGKRNSPESEIRKSYSRQRRVELETLRQKVIDLTEDLNTRQAATRKPSSKWQVLANYNRQKRVRAEAQRQQLIAEISKTSSVIKDLWKLTQNRIDEVERIASLESSLLLRSYPYEKLQFKQTDIDTIAHFTTELDNVYSQTNEALRSSGLQNWSGLRKTWINYSSECFAYVDNLKIPFNFGQTCQNLWRVAHMPHRRWSRQLFGGVADADNTIVIKFRVAMPQRPELELIRLVVARRYAQNGRMVIVWRSFAQGQGLFTGMYADETGWNVVTEKSPTETELRTCIRHQPILWRAGTGRSSGTGPFTGAVLEMGTHEASEIENTLRKLCIQDA